MTVMETELNDEVRGLFDLNVKVTSLTRDTEVTNATPTFQYTGVECGTCDTGDHHTLTQYNC